MIDVERRNESRSCQNTFLLQVFGVLVEHCSGQRTNADQFDITLEPVDQHGQFVKPILAHYASPRGYTPIAVCLVGYIHTAMLVEDNILDIFGIRVHGAELVEETDLTILAYSRQFDERAVEFDLFLRVGLHLTMGKDVLDMSHRYDLVHHKTAVIQASEDFGLGKHAFATFGEVVVQTRRQSQTGNDAFMPEVEEINHPVQREEIFVQDLLFHILLRAIAANIYAVVGQLLVDYTETAVDTFGIVQKREVNQSLIFVIRYLQETEPVAVGYNLCLAGIEVGFFDQHLVIFLSGDGEYGLVDSVDGLFGTRFIFADHFGFGACLDLHCRNIHVLCVLPVMLGNDTNGVDGSHDSNHPKCYGQGEIEQCQQAACRPQDDSELSQCRYGHTYHLLPQPHFLIRAVVLTRNESEEDPQNHHSQEQPHIHKDSRLVGCHAPKDA